jgi:hypothetical protein
MAQPSPDADSSRGLPGWVKIVGIGLIIVILLVVALMLVGGGGGGHTPPPGAH